MGLDDEPTASLTVKNLSAIPAHLRFSNVRNKVKRENGCVTANLHFRINELIAVNPYFSQKRFVIAGERLQAIQATFQKGIKVNHIWSGYLQVTGGVSLAPSVQSRTLDRSQGGSAASSATPSLHEGGSTQ